MKVGFSKRASGDVERIDARWKGERPAAPQLFLDELKRALELVRDAPRMGVGYTTSRGRLVRRVLLERTQYHLYYEVIDDEELKVLALWGTQRGRGPRFGG